MWFFLWLGGSLKSEEKSSTINEVSVAITPLPRRLESIENSKLLCQDTYWQIARNWSKEWSHQNEQSSVCPSYLKQHAKKWKSRVANLRSYNTSMCSSPPWDDSDVKIQWMGQCIHGTAWQKLQSQTYLWKCEFTFWALQIWCSTYEALLCFTFLV